MSLVRCDGLSSEEARGLVVRAQLGDAPAESAEGSTAIGVLRRSHLMQLDGLSTVEKSHRLSCGVRMAAGTTGAEVDASLWSSGRAVSFETYTHAACLFPIEDWPCLQLNRKAAERRTATMPHELLDDVLARVAISSAGLTMKEIEAGETVSGSWAWSDRKRAAEYLVWTGRLVCSSRRGARRIYDLPERRVPAEVLAVLPEDEVLARLGASSLESLGIVTVADVAFHYNLTPEMAELALRACGAFEVTVEGWDEPGYVPGDLDVTDPRRWSERAPALIGPFDGLLRDRTRAERVFGFRYTLEAYKPASQRRYGAYALAVLAGTRFTGRADLRRSQRQQVLNGVHPEPGKGHGEVEAQIVLAAQHLAALLGDLVSG